MVADTKRSAFPSMKECLRESSAPEYKLTVVEIMTKTPVARIAMEARPTAFCFILYSRSDTAIMFVLR